MRTNTLIIFSCDNGGPAPGRVTMNTPQRADKGTIYEGGVRVCAFASWPGRIPAGATNHEPMRAVDWYPTLLKLAGVSPGPARRTVEDWCECGKSQCRRSCQRALCASQSEKTSVL